MYEVCKTRGIFESLNESNEKELKFQKEVIKENADLRRMIVPDMVTNQNVLENSQMKRRRKNIAGYLRMDSEEQEVNAPISTMKPCVWSFRVRENVLKETNVKEDILFKFVSNT